MQQNSILHQKFQKQKSFKQKYAIILLPISQLSAVGTFFYIHSTYEQINKQTPENYDYFCKHSWDSEFVLVIQWAEQNINPAYSNWPNWHTLTNKILTGKNTFHLKRFLWSFSRYCYIATVSDLKNNTCNSGNFMH